MLGKFRVVAFLPTTDYVRAREFFVDKLGLELVSQDQFALVLRARDNMLRFTKLEKFTPAQGTILGWEVKDISNVVSGLMKKGIAFEKYPFVKDELGLGIWTAPGGDKVAWFKDPDGNVLSLSEHVEQNQ
jgi:catechol 2,3-dioxygenase-like lactoylglutathione lyase family enzyme